ncbi:YcaO-like family protein [uncultured Roseibium sp.]|uniref:YcaO-like family protein n=1 Tax=uncultured Roseibium sp. TaxID=1936171 RepID=UPI00261B117F|nr:YcaO-like family protein [uncultured Roseibium sp.]
MEAIHPNQELFNEISEICRESPASELSRRFCADDYLARLRPHLTSFGITRLADVTGLDRVGIPVVQAVRPLARSNAVNQGKGLTLAEAAVSATIEAVETYACETPEQIGDRASPNDVYGHAAAHNLSCHLASKASDEWAQEPIAFLRGIEPISQDIVSVPAALVSTDYTPSSIHALSPFIRSTTGLGGGASLEEAIQHGFLEVLERISTDQAMTTHGFFEKNRIVPETSADRCTARLISQVKDAGLLFAAFECTPVGRFPVVWVKLLDERASATSLPFAADGFACRPTLSAALRAALLESIQTRASVISGAREDITRSFYPRNPDDQLIAFERRQMGKRSGQNPSFVGKNSPVRMKDFAEALAEAGLTAAIVPVLALKDVPLFIVRIVPLVGRVGRHDAD